MAENFGRDPVPLCVDVDGTLLRTDLLVESVFALLGRSLSCLLLMPFWLLRGKACFKQQIADRVELDITVLPCNEPFLDWLREQHAQGRELVLATASNQKYAKALASWLGIFGTILASDATTNLSGKRKRDRLVASYGTGGFDYAGNARVDAAIWAAARQCIVVNPEFGVLRVAQRAGDVARVFDDRQGTTAGHYLRAVRLHQWLKNTLIFVPLLMAHRASELPLLAQAAWAFLSFGLCASSVYLLNDLLDLQSDRMHPGKRKRPFAAGDLSLVQGIMVIPLLLASSLVIALLLSPSYLAVLALYYVLTLGYSTFFKRVALLDVLVLAGLYTIRIIAGGAVVGVPLSFWLLAFSMFMFLSLALVKRYTELLTMHRLGRDHATGRSYRVEDLEVLSQFGITSAYLSILVLAFYINSTAVDALYSHVELIWLLCPLLLYIMSRIWLLARRDQLHEDPVVFIFRDRLSQLLALAGMFLLWLAI